MTSLAKVFVGSFRTLKKCPKLFLPKVLIAFLYAFPIIAVAGITVDAFTSPNIELIYSSIFWIIFMLAVSFIDVFVNAMYSVMAGQFRKTGDVSFRAAAGTSWKRFIVVVPSVLVVEMGAFAISAALGSVIGIMIAFGSAEGTLIMGAVSLAAIFVMLVAFFLLYPVAALENLGIIATLRRTLSLSRGNLKDVVIASAASMAISLLSFLLAFGFEFALRAGNAAGVIVLVLFILARIFTGVFAAYLYVLNPTFYLEYGLGNAGIARGKGKALK